MPAVRRTAAVSRAGAPRAFGTGTYNRRPQEKKCRAAAPARGVTTATPDTHVNITDSNDVHGGGAGGNGAPAATRGHNNGTLQHFVVFEGVVLGGGAPASTVYMSTISSPPPLLTGSYMPINNACADICDAESSAVRRYTRDATAGAVGTAIATSRHVKKQQDTTQLTRLPQLTA